ncbi:MAG: sugar phosphate isomerase/epimerase family protein [Lachnospiraceae bacterium]
MKKYDFQLAMQLPFPVDQTYEKDQKLLEALRALQENGFSGVELNLTEFEKIEPEQLQKFLKKFDMKMTMVATGAYAKKNHLSLSDTDECNRERSVKELEKILYFAEKADCGVICGFLKGPGNQPHKEGYQQFAKSLSQLAEKKYEKVQLYIEVTNHYESTVANRAMEAGELLKDMPDHFRMLLDTYHMNIEERCMEAVIIENLPGNRDFHISDNNRRFPGYGALDFYRILRVVKSISYNGSVTIEGNVAVDLIKEIEGTASYLANISERLKSVG